MLAFVLVSNASALTLQQLTPLTVGAQNTAVATGASGGGQVTFAYGFAAGNTPVPGCPNASVAIANPTILGTVQANGNGRAEFTGFVPASASGATVRVVAVEAATCAVSNVTLNTFPAVDWADVQPIFASTCSGVSCHWQDNPPSAGGFSLFGPSDMVNVPSQDVPRMDLIEPGAPADSYVWHKINNTQASVGGSGVRMPKNSPALNVQQKDLIEQWILDGALP